MKALKKQLCTWFFSIPQFKVRAYDGGNPPRRSTEADVTISVGQNKQTPQFQRLPYRTNIRENLEVGRGVYTVQARDGDAEAPFNTIRYRIIGDNKAPGFFRINENSGDINLNTSLETDSDSAYTVSYKPLLSCQTTSANYTVENRGCVMS